jgi:tetratricopeptide (TPR) repeat protein
MNKRVMSGRLAIVWLGVLAVVAPAGLAQDEKPANTVTATAREDGPTVPEAQQLQRAERWEDAATAWAAIFEREPENGQAVFNLGYCLHASGRLEEALEMHRRAAGFDEYHGIALYNIGCAHALLGDPETALRALSASQAAGFSLDNALQDSDLDSLHADPRFQTLLTQSPPSTGILQRIQRVAGQAKMMYSMYAPELRRNLDAARGEAEMQAMSLFGRIMQDERFGPIAMRAMQFVQSRQSAGAPEATTAESAPAAGSPAQSLAAAQRLQGSQDWVAASTAYAAVLESDPDNAAAAFGHGYCLHMAGNYVAAIEAHKRAAEFQQFKGISLYNLGCAYAITGKPDLAFKALEGSHEAGFDLEDYLKTDADLESLRKDPRLNLLQIKVEGGL